MKRLFCVFIGLAVSAETTISFSVRFDDLLTKQDQRSMGLQRATPEQRRAFETWAQQFAVGVVQKQRDADLADRGEYKHGFVCGMVKGAMKASAAQADIVEKLSDLFASANCADIE